MILKNFTGAGCHHIPLFLFGVRFMKNTEWVVEHSGVILATAAYNLKRNIIVGNTLILIVDGGSSVGVCVDISAS